MSEGWVLLCPGQGSQYVGMGKALYERFSLVREYFDRADEVLGLDLREIAFSGPDETLRETRNTQPAVYTLDVACAAVLEEAGVPAAAAAGHSLGEYAACAAAGAVAFEAGVRLTRLRGELMHEAGEERRGTMAAVLGLEEEVVRRVLDGVNGVVVAANLNAPGQVVISGTVEAVDESIPALKASGARRAVRLPVSGAFHSPLMEPAAAGLAKALSETEFRDARIPVVANVSSEPLQSADAIRDALRRQLLAPVRWEASIRRLLDSGHRRFVEVGPGKVLQGLLRQIDPAAEGRGVEDPSSLEAFFRIAEKRSVR
jgi:[acyl-carrier-protein] S-malonyltransferase